jgi:hypothetical protein
VPSSQSCVNGFVGVKTVITSSDVDKRIVKAVNKFLDFVSNVHMNIVKQRSIESYFKK